SGRRSAWQNLLSEGICCNLKGIEGLLACTDGTFDSYVQYRTSRPSSSLNGIARKGMALQNEAGSASHLASVPCRAIPLRVAL
ncbi:MAG TPA: hypothetical protein VFQ30_16185, partial [Ktedonobacteraceae bacterium]|nr:hypothetical protein [Ktedonobacteraceae bacterium]